jgi:hypothetical protein
VKAARVNTVVDDVSIAYAGWNFMVPIPRVSTWGQLNVYAFKHGATSAASCGRVGTGRRCRDSGCIFPRTGRRIARGQIRSLVEECVERGVVLADAAYGDDYDLCQQLESMEIAVCGGHPVPHPYGRRAHSASAQSAEDHRTPARPLRRDQHQPLSVRELVLCLSPGDLRRIGWREGTRGTYRLADRRDLSQVPVRIVR